MSNISELEGKILTNVTINDDKDEIIFVAKTGERYVMHHYQDCCENVYVEDVCGDLADIIDAPVLSAYETSCEDLQNCESGTWTFYGINTLKGSVAIRWLGESNGYYSESVDFDEQKSENAL